MGVVSGTKAEITDGIHGGPGFVAVDECVGDGFLVSEYVDLVHSNVGRIGRGFIDSIPHASKTESIMSVYWPEMQGEAVGSALLMDNEFAILEGLASDAEARLVHIGETR